jgi:hypothetical protein
LYFWLFAGLVVVVADERRTTNDQRRRTNDQQLALSNAKGPTACPEQREGTNDQRSFARWEEPERGQDTGPRERVVEISLRWDPSAAADGLVVAALLATMAFSFLRMPGTAAPAGGPVLVALFAVTWIVAFGFWLLDFGFALFQSKIQNRKSKIEGVGSFVVSSLAGPLLFGLWWAVSTALGGDAIWLLAGFYVLILAIVLLLGGTLPEGRRQNAEGRIPLAACCLPPTACCLLPADSGCRVCRGYHRLQPDAGRHLL